MESITSRKNRIISHLRLLSNDGAYRRECGEFVCEGEKTLKEAIGFNMELKTLLWKDAPSDTVIPAEVEQYTAPAELFEYASFLKSGAGPLFTVRIKPQDKESAIEKAIVLENLQDPGNVGTVIRTANAFNIDAVILCGACADIYNPKTVRASMGAIFRQRVLEMSLTELGELSRSRNLPLFGAALSDKASDIRRAELHRALVAIGSEGRGLSSELLDICGGELIIPMNPDSESLNAAVAASVVMWEMSR